MKITYASIRIFIICAFTLLISYFSSPKIDPFPLQEIKITAHRIPISYPHVKKSETSFECLRKNIYFEAANQGEEGMVAVANVILNRLKNDDYPDSICAIVHQQILQNDKFICQFSWYCNDKHFINKSKEAWKMAGVIAKNALKGTIDNPVGDALYFHAKYVHPAWADEKEFITQIGDHFFYK